MRNLGLLLGLAAAGPLWAQQTEPLSPWAQLTNYRGMSLLRWAEGLPWPEGTEQLTFTIRRWGSLITLITVTPSQLRQPESDCERPAKVTCYEGEAPVLEGPCCAGPSSDCGRLVDRCRQEGEYAVRLDWALSGPVAATPVSEATRRFISAAEALLLTPHEKLSVVWRVSPATNLITDTVRLLLWNGSAEPLAPESMPLLVGAGVRFPKRCAIPATLQQDTASLREILSRERCGGKEECLRWVPIAQSPYEYSFIATRRSSRPSGRQAAKASMRSFPGKVTQRPEGTVLVELPWTGSCTLHVWDMQGCLVQSLTAPGPSVQLSQPLPAGAYRLQIISPRGEVYHHTFLLTAQL